MHVMGLLPVEQPSFSSSSGSCFLLSLSVSLCTSTSSVQAKGALAAAVAGAAADLSSISAADLSRGMSSISPAEQMAIVEAAQVRP
jgi:hypothetical protein